jgi:competence protein ComEA
VTDVDPAPDGLLRPSRSRVRIGAGAAVVLVLVGLAVAVLVTALGSHGSAVAVTAAPASSGSARAIAEPTTDVYVHVTGAVVRPGLFVLATGDRVLDAVAAAGGFAPDADQAAINLARPLVDGEQIVVPVVGVVLPPASGGAPGAVAGALVNLNTADAAALDTLPGVGPATAKSILDWREKNGRFSTVEDLLSVSGIGEKTFADLKELVTV